MSKIVPPSHFQKRWESLVADFGEERGDRIESVPMPEWLGTSVWLLQRRDALLSMLQQRGKARVPVEGLKTWVCANLLNLANRQTVIDGLTQQRECFVTLSAQGCKHCEIVRGVGGHRIVRAKDAALDGQGFSNEFLSIGVTLLSPQHCSQIALSAQRILVFGAENTSFDLELLPIELLGIG